MSIEARSHTQFSKHLTLARVTWWLVTLASIGFYLVSAWAFYQILLVNPFFGSTVQPGVNNLNSIEQGLAHWDLSIEAYAAINILSQTLITITCCLLGALIFRQRPTERVAWVMSLLLILLGTLVASQALALAQLYPGLNFVGFLVNQVSTAVVMILFWIFPDGRFVPAWSRWTLLAAVTLGLVVSLWPSSTFATAGVLILFILVGLAIFAQIFRYRHISGPVERQQTKWVVMALIAGPVIWVVGAFLIPALFPALTQTSENAAPFNLLRWTLNNFATLLIPLAIGLSILRYRLWDIDVIIRKTLIYSILTGLLAVVYFGGVVLVQQLTRSLTNSSDLAIVVSTLTIAALFFPLRRRVQNVIDRRFYRRKYDAQKVLEHFASTARNEVELEQLTAELINVVNETMQPTRVSLWLKDSQLKE